MDIISKILQIHSSLKFIGNINTEIPEQLMSIVFIKPDDCVLEFGGSCGRNSCVINTILTTKENHVVIEPSKDELEVLTLNRDNNNLKYQIENSAISHEPLYSYGWYTYPVQVVGSTPVNVLTYNELKEKYKLDFNVLVIDSEGSFVNTLKHYPEVLEGLRLLIIEHDFNSLDDLIYFNNTMYAKHFKLIYIYLKESEYGPGYNWPDGVIGDPVFVSVWEK
jgi:hypothetical protein